MKDFIEIFDNSVPQELCNELVEWFDRCSDKNFTFHNMLLDNRDNLTLRSDESISVPAAPPVSSHSLPDELCNAFWKVLNVCFYEYLEKYNKAFLDLSCHIFKFHKVKRGQGYHMWHYENDGDSISGRRVLAWMTYLKVPEEGGETEFLHQSKRIEPVVGKTVIWPAYFTHLHRGNPPLKGEKYYITGWFERN